MTKLVSVHKVVATFVLDEKIPVYGARLENESNGTQVVLATGQEQLVVGDLYDMYLQKHGAAPPRRGLMQLT